MKKITKVLPMSDGHQVFIRMYQPDRKPVANFHILHGMAEYGARYEQFATLLCEKGFFVTVHDHRGHGKTAELNNAKFGYFADQDGFRRVVEDVYEVIQYTRLDHETRPSILFGHSMGSFIARRYIQLYGDMIDQCILCGTGTTTLLHRIGHSLAKSLALINGKEVESKLLNDLSFGSFNKRIPNAKTAFDWLCTNEQEVKKYIEDPYCGFIPTHQFFVDLTDGLLQINKKNEVAKVRTDLPILFISGSDDPVGNRGKGVFQVAKKMKAVGLERVTVYLFEGMRHEILNEQNKQHVFDVVIRWLEHDKQ